MASISIRGDASVNVNEIRVQILIRADTKHGELHDAIYLPVEEFFEKDGTRKLSDKDVDALVSERVEKYEAAVDAAKLVVPDPPPSDEELFAATVSSMSEAEQVKLKEWLIAKGK